MKNGDYDTHYTTTLSTSMGSTRLERASVASDKRQDSNLHPSDLTDILPMMLANKYTTLANEYETREKN